MTAAIAIRDTMLQLLEATFPEFVGHTVSRKVDTTETFPSASVYVGDITSEPAATKGCVTRTVPVDLVLFRKGSDLEKTFAQNAETMEKAVHAARKTFSPALKKIHLSAVAMQFTPDSKNTEGALHLTFTAETQANLTT